jgi:hypothetical protein
MKYIKSPAEMLGEALRSVTWNANVHAFVNEGALSKRVADENMRLVVWSRQLENADAKNPALCFIREMQLAGHHVAMLTALCIYKAAGAAMRTMWDTALYYSYFRTHPVELSTQANNPKFFLEKREIIEFHKNHTPQFEMLQQRLGLLARLERWYSFISAVIHGQVPGTWVEHTAISEIRYSKTTASAVAENFGEGVDLVHRLFLCTVGRTLWDGFSSAAKKKLLSGLPGDIRTVLELNRA